MGKWTRRDLVKASLAASAAAISKGELLAQATRQSANPVVQSPLPVSAGTPDTTRERLLLDFGWRFALGNANDPAKDFGFGKLRGMGTFAKAGQVDGPASPKFDDSGWKKIDVPHDWAIDLPFVNEKELIGHGAKPLAREYPDTSVGWYRREFVLPESDAGKRITIEFDGIFRDASVFFNGHYVAENMSGYAPLAVDVTDIANFGSATPEKPGSPAPGRNVLVVRVNSTLDEGWFYEGAGIYRHVWLMKTAPVHLVRWGTFVRSDFAKPAGAVVTSADPATVLIDAEVINETDAPVSGRVHVTLNDASGKSIGTAVSAPATIPPREQHTFALKTQVTRPALWSCEEPNLYRAVATLETDGKPTDSEHHTFGIRTIHYDADRGFFLNGKSVKIKGTCNHQDHAGVGAAVPDRIQSYRVERLKWLNSNGIRTSHNAPTPELLDACDRLGMMIMDETRMMASSPEGLSELERLIRRDRNHPCVIIWSLGNEEPEQANTRGARIVASMRRLQRKLDPTRPCTLAMNHGWGGNGASNSIDVQGFNYNHAQIDPYHSAHPKQPVIGTETGSTVSTRGIYANDTEAGYVASYDTERPPWAELAEDWWSFNDDRPWLAGGFVWTGFDYRGEPTPYGWPCISSHFGLLDTCGFPKDNGWYYRVWWGTEPALHLFPHWNWAGKEGQEIDVWAYSNQDSVELFLNGASLGSQPVKKNGHVAWKVKYAPGTIEARASKNGRVTLTDKRETTGPAAKIVATADRARINADGQDVSVINVQVADAQGRTAPTANNKITFAVSGPGAVIGVGNGDPSCHEPDRATDRSAFNGLCMAIVQTRRAEPGQITINVTSPGLEPATVTLQAESGPLPPVV